MTNSMNSHNNNDKPQGIYHLPNARLINYQNPRHYDQAQREFELQDRQRGRQQHGQNQRGYQQQQHHHHQHQYHHADGAAPRMPRVTVKNPTEDQLRAEGIAVRDFAVEAEERKKREQREELAKIQADLQREGVAVRDFAYPIKGGAQSKSMAEVVESGVKTVVED